MQSLLASLTTATAVVFSLIFAIDFLTGLAAVWRNAGSKEVQSQSQPAAQGQAIAPQVEETSVPQVKPVIAPQKVATLEWVMKNLPAAEVYAVEMPDVIAMAKAKLRKVAPVPVVQLASRQELIDLGIRRCKKLASQLKVRRYNVMKLSELADVLVGKIAVSDLAS